MEEKELLHRIQTGNDSAFDYFVNLHREMVYSLCLNMLKSQMDAKDIMQEVFLRVYKSIGKFDGKSSLKTWVYRICYNRCLDEIKKKSRFAKLKEAFSYRAITFSKQSHTFERQLISEALGYLNVDDRALLTFYYLEELDLKEISDIMNINENTLKTRLFRARTKLKEIIETKYKNEIEDLRYG
ncbi:MAG: sigma-70 family RNA polymerase sigma factor [Candidatus Kapaibacteriales bacterium]